MTHDVSCRCTDCRARRAAAFAVQTTRTDVTEMIFPEHVEGVEDVEGPPENRRRKGIKRILMGVGIILVALFLAEGITWLIFGEFGSFGFIDALFVLLGAYHILKGLYEVLTPKPAPESAGDG